jgi:hypothetical protein
MAETKITQLVISPSIDGTEYLIVDNTEVTRRTTINSLSSVVQTWSIPCNTILQSNSATWNNTSSTVQSNSATWSQGNSAVNTVVQSNSATWSQGIEPVYTITSNYTISADDTRKQFIYSSTNNITAFITASANIDNFSCTFSQLDYGSITIKFDPTYTSGSIISINNIDTTITKGASINIKRTANNQFLVSPVFFSLVQ